ncbi:MAG: hypothetical protein ACJA2S_004440 [Cyclobacteriaceae bacterium]|jgi:hypothetical protein
MGIRECKFANRVEDSLTLFWEGYEMKDHNQIFQQVKPLTSNKEDGYQVFFSDIYKRTLAAELKSFCSPYKKYYWQGSSTIYYFYLVIKERLKRFILG